jgi:hypothetical protein
MTTVGREALHALGLSRKRRDMRVSKLRVGFTVNANGPSWRINGLSLEHPGNAGLREGQMTAVAACPWSTPGFAMGVADQSATPITGAATWSNGLTP